MAAQVKVTFKQDLTEPVKIRHYEGVVFTGDDCGNLVKVALFDGGTPYSGGGTVSATAVLADGTTFPLTQGSITGNMVSVPLEAGALVVSGLMGLYVKISGDGIICTVLNAIFTVQATDTGMVPAAMVTTVNELVQEIKDAQDSFPADLTNLLAAVAPTFSTSTAYSAGAYVWQGGKLYRFTAAHPAGTWTGMDAAEVALGNDVADLKSAFGNTIKQQIAFVQTANSTTNNYYKTFTSLSADKCYLIRLTVETAGTYTLRFGTGQSSGAMVDTVGSATVQANVPYDFIGYVPSLSTFTTSRLSVSTPHTIDIYEIENISNIRIACIRSSDKIINTAGQALAPYSDLDTLPTNETVTYVNASSLNIQHTPNFGNFTVITFTPYAESNDGGKIQVAYRADSGFGMAFRSYWGSAYTDWKYVAIEGHTDEVQALQSDAIKSSNKLVNTNGSAQAPYNDLDSLPLNGVVTYVSADNLGILHRPDFKSFTVITTSYTSDNVGGTVQIAFAINSTFGMAYRNRWGANAVFGDWYYISSKNDVADSIVADLPFTSISCFLRIGVIGDSYASGWLNVSGSVKDWYSISWIQQMAREYGVTGINFSKAGLTTRSWLTDENGLTKLNNTDPCDLYWIVLGINDVETLGLDYLGSIADCTETPLSNPDTFYGNMGRIMYYVQQQAPHAHIIFSTMANSSGNYPAFNAAIQEIATHYGVGCIVQLDDPFFTSRFYTVYKRSSHPTVQLYGGMSKAIARLTDKCMRANPGYFNDIWPTSEP